MQFQQSELIWGANQETLSWAYIKQGHTVPDLSLPPAATCYDALSTRFISPCCPSPSWQRNQLSLQTHIKKIKKKRKLIYKIIARFKNLVLRCCCANLRCLFQIYWRYWCSCRGRARPCPPGRRWGKRRRWRPCRSHSPCPCTPSRGIWSLGRHKLVKQSRQRH